MAEKAEKRYFVNDEPAEVVTPPFKVVLKGKKNGTNIQIEENYTKEVQVDKRVVISDLKEGR